MRKCLLYLENEINLIILLFCFYCIKDNNYLYYLLLSIYCCGTPCVVVYVVQRHPVIFSVVVDTLQYYPLPWDTLQLVSVVVGHPLIVYFVVGHPSIVYFVVEHPLLVYFVVGHPLKVYFVMGHPLIVYFLVGHPEYNKYISKLCRIL